ncbi:methionine aminotransferase [Anditalea andensis]|uniref:Aminotransferase n=1 Tax=Anditalea andensis TaxID=1048983 RepID=A0A074KW89_9BACT|nr:methionine aminotransferase [Anditalea andensis]KEO72505.1 aminotransferase [Anditalea andensis]
MSLISKLPAQGTSIFTIMTHLAEEHNAINLAQGFPGFPCDPHLTDLAAHYIKEGNNQYAPSIGIPVLRKRISQMAELMHGVFYKPETEITITSGATEALYVAITAVVKTGDEVIIMEPAYDAYGPSVRLNGGVPVYVPLDENDFSIDWDRLEGVINEKTTLIIVNTPHNPSGYVWKKDDVDHLAKIISDKPIFVISDEVYEHIVFDKKEHYSLMRNPILRDKTFICSSFGKTLHVTGWKIGYCLAPEKMSKEFRKIHQYIAFSTATPLQYAIAAYLDDDSKYLELSAFYQKKRDIFCEGLKAYTPFKFTPAEGSFFQTVSYRHLSTENDFDLAVRLTKKAKVACIPNTAFYKDKSDLKVLRFCFAKDEAELELAISRLSYAVF